MKFILKRRSVVMVWITLLLICFSCKEVHGIRNACTNKYFPCGDGKCCCETLPFRAYCNDYGSMLNYIPNLPKYIAELEFSNNSLPSISRQTFTNLSGLCIGQLTLSNNTILGISNDSFEDMSCLTSLSIGGNLGLAVGELAEALSKVSLRHLSLDNLDITQLSSQQLRQIDGSNLETLILKNNNIQAVDMDVFCQFERITKIDLSYNGLRYIDLTTRKTMRLQKLYLQNNNLGPDLPNFCHNISTYNHGSMDSLWSINIANNYIETLKLTRYYCLTNIKDFILSGNRIITVQSNAFESLSSLQHLQFDHMGDSLTVIEQMAFNNANLTSLTLNRNAINFQNSARISLDMFKGLNGLTALDISNNNLFENSAESIEQLLSPLHNLQRLTAVAVKLTRIPSGVFRVLPHLDFLHLDANSIHSISGTFTNVSNLKHLSLFANTITNVQQEDLPDNLLGSLIELNLAENALDCTCVNLWFRNWIDRTVDKGNITLKGWPRLFRCKTPISLSNSLMKEYNPTSKSCAAKHIALFIYSSAAGIVIVLFLANILIYKKRWYIRYWLYKIRQWKKNDSEQMPLLGNMQYLYDGYVIYHDDDRDFVHGDLRTFMEDSCGFKLHIWHRDAEHGVKLEVMFDAIYASRKVLVVVSSSFLSDEECQFQLYVAMDRNQGFRNDGVVVVLLGDLEADRLTKYWCVALTKLPSAVWSSDNGSVKRDVFEQEMLNQFDF